MRIKYQVLIAPATKYSTPSTDQRLGLWAAICSLQVPQGEENTFILLNMGLICFTTNKNVREPQREQEGFCSAAKNKKQKMTLSKLEQSFKKEGKKTSISPKSRDNVKAECSGNRPSEPGVSPQFLTVHTGRLTAISPKQWSAMLHWNERFHRRKQLQLADSTCFSLLTRPPEDGSRCFTLTVWVLFEGVKNGSQKCVQSRQYAHRSVRGSDTPVKWKDKMWFHCEFIWA